LFEVQIQSSFSPSFAVERACEAVIEALAGRGMRLAAQAVCGIWVLKTAEVKYELTSLA
jgi:hypothetical protein